MAVIRDMIPAFELFQPADVDGAVSLLARYGKGAWVLAGGLDSMDWFKDRIKRPEAVIDVGAIDELRGIHATDDGGLEIGAMTTLADVAASTEVREKYGLLAEAAGLVATPQIRHQGTLGGNLCQDTRCWYYRGGWPCYRAGGNICYADTPTSMDREHCLFGANRCVAVNPSDTAPAAVALDAQMVIRGPGGERVVAAKNFFLGPAVDITRMTVLDPDELLVSIRLPEEWAGASYYFEKVRDRKSWDFALVSIAGAFQMDGGTITEARLAVGAIAPTPIRLERAEAAVRGHTVDDDLASRAGELAIAGAKPLHHNGFKIPLMRNLVKRALQRNSTNGSVA